MPPGTASPKLLILDDDALMRLCYASIFRKLDGEFDWRLEAHPRDALASLERERADVMILDWDLPEMSGGDVLDRLRAARERRPRVLVITGRTGSAHERAARERGADDFLSKPFEPAVLLSRLRELLRR